tara:strand:- start:312 stop:1364 length:1053 start_codon:yes stop_codon:yes gene_type:complete
MKLLELGEVDSLNFPIYGWNVTSAPPKITSTGSYSPTPASIEDLESATSILLPSQKLDVNTFSTQNLSFTYSNGGWPTQRNPWWSVWGKIPGYQMGYINLIMGLPFNCTVNLILDVACMKNAGNIQPAGFTVEASGTRVFTSPVIRSPSYQKISVPIPFENTLAGGNFLQIKGAVDPAHPDQSYFLHIRSIELATHEIPIKAQSYWKRIGASIIPHGSTYKHSLQIREGVTSSETTSNQFSKTLGLGTTATYGVLAAQLSGSFTKNSTKTHNIELSKVTVSTHEVSVNGPSKSENVRTIEIWQLCLRYVDGNNSGHYIDVDLGMDNGLLIVRKFDGLPPIFDEPPLSKRE